MHSIERYGIVALIFLVVTVVAVLVWDGDKTKKKPKEPAGAPLPAAAAAAVPGLDEGAKLALSAKPEPGPLTRAELAANSGLAQNAQPPAITPAPLSGEQAPADLSAARFETPPGESQADGTRSGTSAGSGLAPLQAQPTPKEEPAHDRPIAAAPAQAGTHTYVVRAGDTLSEIALAELGSSRRYKEIVAANPGIDPSRIRLGTKLQIPGAARSVAGGAEAAAKQAAGGEAGTRSPSTPSAERTWTVGSGESLWRIAERALGDGKRWGEIAALNPGVHPDKLELGQVLKLPGQAARAAQGATAERAQGGAPRIAAQPSSRKSSAPLVASATASERATRGGKVK